LILLSTQTTPDQIDTWRTAKSENETLEFKEAKNQFDFKTLLSYCVALANERGGFLLLGISNQFPRPVVGTNAYPNTIKTAEDIFNKLRFRVDVEEVQHPDGRVLVFHIPSRPTGHPYHLDGSYFMRTGESLVAMSPDQLKKIFAEGGSGRRGWIVFISAILLLSVAGFFSVKYWDAAHKPKQRDLEIEPADRRGSTTLSTQKAPASGHVDWHDKHNWRGHLRMGMTRTEVRRLFGEAERIYVSSEFETWDYGSGEITFIVDADSADGRIFSWSEPR
jgi:hypothetical protein